MNSATVSGNTYNYAYNAFDERVSKSGASVNKSYVYNESNQVIGEYDSTNSIEYIYFGSIPVGVYQNGQIYYIHTDHLNTPRAITNNSQTLMWKWDNTDPFGKNSPVNSGIDFNLRFSGQIFDNESGLNYNYYRYYNPETGRYMQADPIGIKGGFDTYSYVGQNPVNFNDPLGLWMQYVLPPVVGGVIGGVLGYVDNGWKGLKEGTTTGVITGLSITGSGRLIGGVIGEGAITQISANAFGSVIGETGRQLIFENECNMTNIGFAAVAGTIFSPISKPYILKNQPIVSWAKDGIEPDLNSGRWVMTGFDNARNYWLSGVKEQGASLNNFTKGVINGSNLEYPPIKEVYKGLWGQRKIKN